MAPPCPTCQQLICDDTADTALYSIEASLFPFVLNCPPGFDCGGSDGFKMLCCGQLVSVTFPAGATADQKTTLIQGVVNECAAILPLCNQMPGCQAPPCTNNLFYNRPQTCSIPCPDGTLFFYTTPAGLFADFSQAIADMEALDYACQQVALRRLCMGKLPNCLCFGSTFTAQVPSTGGLGPIRFSVSGGSFPPGLSLSSSGVISGIPSLSGVFPFSIKATANDGSYVIKPFSMSVIKIESTSLPNYTIGVPYSYQLLASGGSGNYAWKIVSGSLPSGLTMDINGLISGTPT
jgi:hypothetical protein